MYVEIQTLPGYIPRRRRRRRRRCRYPKGTKGKARWRHARRKFKRNKKRRIKKLRSSKSKKSKSSAASAESKAKMERRKKMRKRKRLRKKKNERRRHRIKRHLYGTEERKTKALAKKKMTKEQIIQRLAELRMRRIRILQKFYRNRAMICSPKRKAIRHLKKCWRRARHQRKKYMRYRRHLEMKAKKKNLEKWRYCHFKKDKKASKKQVTVTTPKKEPKPKVVPSKRVEYVNKYPLKVPVPLVEMKNEEIHCSVKNDARVQFNNVILRLRENVVGEYGRVACKIHYVDHSDQASAELRWQAQLIDDKTGSKDAKILAKLAYLRSPNTVRVLYYGQFQNLQCLVTTRMKTFKPPRVERYEPGIEYPVKFYTLEDCLREVKQLDMPWCVHIIQQTFYCVKDLHKAGYSHLAISPSNFSFLVRDQRIMAFTNFEFARTRQSLREKKPIFPEDTSRRRKPKRLPKLHMRPYMSRRQHLRMVKGPADDYESWFYVCARVLNEKKPLKWVAHKSPEPLTHMQMAKMKYEFLGQYKHPDKLADKKMKQILNYCLAVTDSNTNKVAYFIERIIQHWMEKLAKQKKEPIPWVDKSYSEKNAMEHAKVFLDDNKEWFKPKPARVCKY